MHVLLILWCCVRDLALLGCDPLVYFSAARAAINFLFDVCIRPYFCYSYFL